MTKDVAEAFNVIKESHNILVIQSERPDGDSLATALMLEDILEESGKKVSLYCAVTMPEYIRFIDGWDRVSNEIPKNIDASILIDNSALALIEKFDTSVHSMFIKTKPFILIDHHALVNTDIPYITHDLSKENYASAGELVYDLFSNNGYKISLQAKKLATQSILSDTLGLTNDLATSKTYRIIADFIDDGVDRAELEENRRRLSKMDRRVFEYKAQLMERTEFYFDNELAVCVITDTEAFDVGTLYNPGPLILSELLMVKDVKVAIAIKTYHNRATAAIRCTHGNDVAHKLAERFGGGGHPYSAGFRIENYNGDIAELKASIVSYVKELL
jgi:phosphoesterase RecJ-like protein